jgi:hypothetical protein
MGRSLTLEIEESTYRELERLVGESGAKIEDALAEAIEAYLAQRREYQTDSFFLLGKGGSSGLGNLAETHNEYLYGANKGESD